MSRTHKLVRGALLLGASGAVAAACTNSDAKVVTTAPNNSIFLNYVAIGNSITAGYQSGGINDSTQRQSYAGLLATQMGTRYAYPSIVMPGCPPPVANFLTQARVGGASSTGSTCLLRANVQLATLNNVAVPGVATADPTALGLDSPNRNTLTQLILGGETMVRKALDADPTFATVWIGNNDVLVPALSGFPSTATPLAKFSTNYGTMMQQLLAGAPTLKGVLIGVVNAQIAPIMIPAAAFTNPAVLGAATSVAGRPVSLDPLTCTGNNLGALVSFQYIAAIKARPGAPANGQIFCQKVAGGGPSDPGDNGILDIGEEAQVTALVNSYNAYIKAKADSIGWGYYDPNVTVDSLKTAGAVPVFPNLAAPTAPFGQYVSLDGVHPAGPLHRLFANALIDIINKKYSTTISHVP